jgi:hypothetical protein
VCLLWNRPRRYTSSHIVHNCHVPVLSYMSLIKTGAFKIDITELTPKIMGRRVEAIERASLLVLCAQFASKATVAVRYCKQYQPCHCACRACAFENSGWRYWRSPFSPPSATCHFTNVSTIYYNNWKIVGTSTGQAAVLYANTWLSCLYFFILLC